MGEVAAWGHAELHVIGIECVAAREAVLGGEALENGCVNLEGPLLPGRIVFPCAGRLCPRRPAQQRNDEDDPTNESSVHDRRLPSTRVITRASRPHTDAFRHMPATQRAARSIQPQPGDQRFGESCPPVACITSPPGGKPVTRSSLISRLLARSSAFGVEKGSWDDVKSCRSRVE